METKSSTNVATASHSSIFKMIPQQKPSPDTISCSSESQGTISTACDSTGTVPLPKYFVLPIPPSIYSKAGFLRISQFKDVQPFAEGTSALLYKAKSPSNKSVIIKMIKKSVQYSALAMKEFEFENSVLACASHPNIVRYVGSGTEPRRFIVVEYINQGTLGMVANTNMSFYEALSKGRELASALQYLHTNCVAGGMVIHRDLKPENIGISNGSVQLFDFGLSICVQQRTTFEEVYEMTGCTGTLRYMAPEVALKQPYNEKVDVYSFALVLWQMVTSKVPFRKASKEEYYEHVVRGGIRPPVHPAWPADFIKLLQASWDPSPRFRPSFDEILRVLDYILLNLKPISAVSAGLQQGILTAI